jgi:hypothetical protein
MGILEALVADKLQRKMQGEQAAKNRQAYQPLLRQLPTTAAGALGPLLTANDAAVQQQGQSLLAEYLQRQSPEARQGRAYGEGQLAAQRLAQQSQGYRNTLSALEEKRRQAAFPGQLKGQQIQNQGGLLSQELTRLQIDALKNPAPAAAPTLADTYERVNGGKLPSGHRAQLRITPQGDQFLDAQPIEGTPDYVKSVTAARKAEDGLELIDTFLDQLVLYGTEKGGGKARLLKQSRDRLLANYGTVMQSLGVLQPGDLERLDAALPDPTSFGNQLNPMAAESIAKVYQQFYEQWKREVLGPARETYWWVEPRPVTPEEQAGGR